MRKFCCRIVWSHLTRHPGGVPDAVKRVPRVPFDKNNLNIGEIAKIFKNVFFILLQLPGPEVHGHPWLEALADEEVAVDQEGLAEEAYAHNTIPTKNTFNVLFMLTRLLLPGLLPVHDPAKG